MNFSWRQSIVGLLRHAGDQLPTLASRCTRTSQELDQTLTSPWLEKAFTLFQEAAALSHDPVFVTGAYYTMRALDEVRRWEDQAGGPVELVATGPGEDDQVTHDSQLGIIELFDRIRNGATLEEALSLFPQIGDEHSPD